MPTTVSEGLRQAITDLIWPEDLPEDLQREFLRVAKNLRVMAFEELDREDPELVQYVAEYENVKRAGLRERATADQGFRRKFKSAERKAWRSVRAGWSGRKDPNKVSVVKSMLEVVGDESVPLSERVEKATIVLQLEPYAVIPDAIEALRLELKEKFEGGDKTANYLQDKLLDALRGFGKVGHPGQKIKSDAELKQSVESTLDRLENRGTPWRMLIQLVRDHGHLGRDDAKVREQFPQFPDAFVEAAKARTYRTRSRLVIEVISRMTGRKPETISRNLRRKRTK